MLSEIWYNYADGTREKAYSYAYTAYGDLYKFTNHREGKSTVYKYDTTRRLVSVVEYNENDMTHRFSTGINYDADGRLGSSYYDIVTPVAGSTSNFTWRYQYFYNNDGSLNKLSVRTDASNGSISYEYDDFDRLLTKSSVQYLDGNTSKSFRNNVSYTYRTYSTDHTDSLVETYTSTINSGTGYTYTYEYDSANNITKIIHFRGVEIRYYYDELSQLIREDNELLGYTGLYEYDTAGNILALRYCDLTAFGETPSNLMTLNYVYADSEWGDQLVSYRGQTITYDEIGNPLSYFNGLRYTFTWDGRRMSTATVGGVTYTFTYNDDGLLTSKSYGNTTIQYFYDGSLLAAELCDDYMIVYMYDESGAPIGMTYRGADYAADVWDVYWYEKNLQGDIVAVYNGTGSKLASYTYDAWGVSNVTYYGGGASTSVVHNPYKYRGYYYDNDLGLYRTGVRYYDAVVCRFISPDNLDFITMSHSALMDNNLYLYCDNNPVNRSVFVGTNQAVLSNSSLYLKNIADMKIVSVSIAPLLYDTPLYLQGNTILCWAYCQIMVEDYKSNMKRSLADASETAHQLGLTIFTDGNFETYYPTDRHSEFTPSNIVELYFALQSNNAPIYGFYSNSKTGDAHYIVITGVDIEKNLVYTNNPWGVKGVQTFEAFCNGVATNPGGNNKGMKLVCVYYN